MAGSIAEVYETSPIKATRNRRTNEDLEGILDATLAIIESTNGKSITLRHLFYRLVSIGCLKKSEKEYKSLCRYIMKWRRSSEVPWDAFADNTRWWYKKPAFSNMEEALWNTRNTYRRNIWATQGAYVEIWCEKDAIASILYEEAEDFGVPVFPLRGFASGTALHSAADGFKQQIAAGKEVYIYYFGDRDPSGAAIDGSVITNLKEDHGIDAHFHFERVAILPEQIEFYNLPTRPTKKSDPRAAKFEGESVEIDAMPMDALRKMVTYCIVNHIDQQEWAAQQAIEQEERATLNTMINVFMAEAV